MRGAFAIPGYRRLFVALAATMVADSVLFLTLGMWVMSLTGSPGAAGMTVFWIVAPTLVAPLLGWVVDQFPRRAFLTAGYPVAILTVLPLLCVHDAHQTWVIYLVAALYGTVGIMLPAADTALVKLLVPTELLVGANAATGTFKQGLRLAGPLLGAALYTAFGIRAVIGVVAGCYLLAVLVVGRLRVPEDVRAPAELRWTRELLLGISHVRRDAGLAGPVLAVAAAFVVFGSVEAVIYAIVHAFGQPPEVAGVIVSVQGAGAVAGGVASRSIITRLGHTPAIVVALGCFTVGLVGQAVAPSMAVVLAAAAPLGFGLPVMLVAINTLIQVRTPARILGRVSTAIDAVIGTPQLVAIAAGSALTTLLDYRIILGAAAVGMAVTAFALHRTTARRVSAEVEPDSSRWRAA